MAEQNNRLTPQQAAARIGLGWAALAKMRMRGDGPEYLKIGNKVRYEPEAVDRWIESRRRTQTKQPQNKSPTQQATA